MTRSFPKTATLNLAALALLVVPACGKPGAGAPDDSASEPGAVATGVTVATVGTMAFTESLDALGVVVARPGRITSGAAPAPTRVLNVFVTVGATTHAGDTLVSFERVAFDAAVQSAEAALAAAEKAAARAERLVAAGVLPRKEAESAAAELAMANANVVNARRSRDLSVLRASIDGVVTRVNVVPGASVDAGQMLVEVTDPSNPDILVQLAPRDAARVHVGTSLDIGSSASVGSTPLGNGRIAEIAAVVDSASRTVAARASYHATTRSLRIGETVFARIVVAEHANAIVIPAEALVPNAEGYRLFVVDDDGIAHAREVTVGGRSDRGIWISEGLKAGERIVTRGAFGIDDSVRVVPVRKQP